MTTTLITLLALAHQSLLRQTLFFARRPRPKLGPKRQLIARLSSQTGADIYNEFTMKSNLHYITKTLEAQLKNPVAYTSNSVVRKSIAWLHAGSKRLA